MFGVRALFLRVVLATGLLLIPGTTALGQMVDPGAYRRPERGAAPVAAGDDDVMVLRNQADIQAVLEDLRTDVQVTQAKVEELTVQFAQLLEEIQALRDELAARTAEAAADPDTAPETFPTLARPRQRDTAPVQSSRRTAPPQEVTRSQPPTTLDSPSSPEPGAAVARPTIRATPAPRAASPEEQFAVYEAALNDYHGQNYALARDAFTEFLRRYPGSTYANNAQFYIGQCHYAEGQYQDAIAAYQVVLDRYPRGTKVPSALLKMGYAMEKVGDRAEARQLLQKVVDTYPFSSEAQLARDRLKTL